MIISWLLSLSLTANLEDYSIETLKLKSRHDDWTIDVKIYNKNANSQPKGIVFVLPGTDGIGHPDMLEFYSDSPFKGQPNPIGRQVISEGYTFVAFNTRGVRPIESCLPNKGKQPSFTDFEENCIDFSIRAKIRFHKIESDIQTVLSYFRTHPKWNGMKTAIIAVSEGGVHVNRLIRLNKINPNLLIEIGTPTSSPHHHFRDQISQNVSYQILRNWMVERKMDRMQVNDFDLAMPILPDDNRKKLKFLIGLTPDGLSLDRLSVQSKYMYEEFDKLIPTFIRKKNAEITGLNFFDYEIKNFVNGDQNRDFLTDKTNLKDSLRKYQGPKIFIYGEYDSLVLHSKESACDKNDKNCEYHLVPQVSHGLVSPENEFSREALSIISEALKKIDK